MSASHAVRQDAAIFAQAKLKLADNKISHVLTEPAGLDASLTLQIQYDPSDGRAVLARVVLADGTPASNELLRTAGLTVRPGDDLPYVKTDPAHRPSVDATVQLYNLCPEQEFAFRLIMQPLLRAINGERDVPQLTFSLHGHAGSGKSKIINAVLWYLFQYDSSHLVVVTSYCWKAAQLISTPANPGFSSCTTFGINDFQPSKSPGETPACHAIINPRVVMIINDEISFTTPAHLQVRSHTSTSIRNLNAYLVVHFQARNMNRCLNPVRPLSSGYPPGLPSVCPPQPSRPPGTPRRTVWWSAFRRCW